MAIESYEEIMARLNEQQSQTPKAATDFTTYVQNLLLNTNPQGGMMSDAEAYRADPFRRQNAINASLEEALKKKQAEEAARAAAVGGGGGMFGRGGSGDSGNGNQSYSSWMDAQEGESEEARQDRIAQWAMENPIQAQLMGYMQGAFALHPLGLLQEQMAPGTQEKYNINDITNRVRDAAIIAAENRRKDAAKAAAAAEAARAQQAAAEQAAAQSRAAESGIPAVFNSGGGSFTVVDSGGNSTTYTGSGGYGGGGSLEATFGGGL